MSPYSVSSLFFCCLLVLLLPAQHMASSQYASYKVGSRQVFFKTPGKSSGNSQQASTVPSATTCSSSIATGLLSNNKLPVVHRRSPCSPLHGRPSLTTADVLRRDTSRIRRSLSSQPYEVAAPAPALAATTVIPTNGSSDPEPPPGTMDYTVLVSYGTPEQQFPVFLDNSFGTTLLQCKPCPPGADGCGTAFDTSRSSTFTHVLCGSPDCPTNCSDGSVCPFDNRYLIGNGAFAQDVLTLAPSMAVHNFTFVCVDVDEPLDQPEAGIIDLSRNRNSLPSRLSSSLFELTATFSYCLPSSPNSHGFLALGGNATVRKNSILTAHAPLVSSSYPELSNMYFIDLVVISLAGQDVPFPAGTFGGKAGTTLDIGTTFTMLAPHVYATLRDAFKKEMSQYSDLSVPEFDGFDTCFNFTGQNGIEVPGVQLKFSNGETLEIDVDQMLYFDDPAAAPFTVTCLAFSSLDDGGDVFSAVIGTYTLGSMEVVYDVAGGKVGFFPGSC